MDESMVTTNTANADFPDRSDSATMKVRPYLKTKTTAAPIVRADSSELVAVTIKVPVIIQSWPNQRRDPSLSELVTGKETVPSSQLTTIAVVRCTCRY